MGPYRSMLNAAGISYLRDMDLKMFMIDEVHNLLAGSYREQRRFLNMLRFVANDKGGFDGSKDYAQRQVRRRAYGKAARRMLAIAAASLVVFGVNEALDAIRGDDQLARRLDEHFLPLWEDDVEFSRLILGPLV